MPAACPRLTFVLCLFVCVSFQKKNTQVTEKESDEPFRLTCFKCVRSRGERNPNFRDDCHDGIAYLPQVHGDWDMGGLYVCGGACLSWLIKHAKKRGWQTNVDQYTTSAYNSCGIQSWQLAVDNSYKFVDEVCDEEDAAELAKRLKKKKRKRARREQAVPAPAAAATASASAAASAIPPPPPPPPPGHLND